MRQGSIIESYQSIQNVSTNIFSSVAIVALLVMRELRMREEALVFTTLVDLEGAPSNMLD